MEQTPKRRFGGAMAFLALMGIVSLFSDMTHEGARSILGEYLGRTYTEVKDRPKYLIAQTNTRINLDIE